MPHMHFAHIPRHVVRRKRYFNPCSNALLVNRIHILHPHGHPGAFVALFISVHLKRGGIRSLPSPALRSLTKKNLALARTHCSKCWRRPPIPAFFPAPFSKPSKARANIRNIQNRRNPFCIHKGPRIPLDSSIFIALHPGEPQIKFPLDSGLYSRVYVHLGSGPMQIGVAAKKVGLSIDAIRFYERNALLPRAPRTEGGFRQYGDKDLETLAFIRRAQGLGFRLKE